MQSTMVTSKGQMTIPKDIRQKPGRRRGSKINVRLINDHIELYVSNSISDVPSNGFAMLKSNCKAIPSDFDCSNLLDNH